MSKNAISGKSVYEDGTGVRGRSDSGKASYGVLGRSASGFAGYFNGNVVVTGTFTQGSDERLKENMKFMADYYLSHSLSPATAAWPNLPNPIKTRVLAIVNVAAE